MCTPYVCLAWKQYLNIIIANPCIRNLDNMNCNIWKLVSHNYSHPCYSLYIHNIITHFLHVEKQRKLIKKKKQKKKLSKGGKKNGVQHFIQRSCDQDGGWSSLLEDICAQGFLFQKLAVECCCLWYITRLMVITTINNHWNVMWLIIKIVCHIYFLSFQFLAQNVVYIFIYLYLSSLSHGLCIFFGN